jgi:pimeloyl-ACP methyl ester carboxylesterase
MRSQFALATFVVALILATTAAQATEQTLTIGGTTVVVWSQGTGANVKKPVIIFSHGFHGCATQSRFLMEAFEFAGYLVFAPNHHDATCRGGETKWRGRPDVPFGQPETWDPTSYRDRADDVRRLLDALRTDDRFRTRADWSSVGLVGHSLGGYTVLELAGAWPAQTLGGVKAVLALSPYADPFIVHHTLDGLSVPVMYQGGTRDFGITPSLRKGMGAYDQSPVPKYYVEFEKAGHLAWTNMSNTAHESIVAYSVAFMNHYVKREPADRVLTRRLSDVVQLHYASELGTNGSPASKDAASRGSGGYLHGR